MTPGRFDRVQRFSTISGKGLNMSDDERAIREAIATWMRVSAEGDAETVLSLMADDVVFFVAGRPPFGKQEFAAAQGGLAGSRIEGTSNVREVIVSGDWAFCSTDLTVVMTPADGAPVRRSGNTLSVFRRLPDGRWVLARDANLLTVER
jgi:uncharacterized protein (TIGR02246 family)